MKKILYIFGQLNNQDVEWLTESGRKLRLKPGDVLVKKGDESHHLYIVLEGSLSVMTGKDDSIKIASLECGEVVGEISFLDGGSPSATVQAETDCTVYSILNSRIEDKIKADEGFGVRLYKALALFLTERLRAANSKYNESSDEESKNEEKASLDELNSIMTDNVGEAGRRFTRLLTKMQDL